MARPPKPIEVTGEYICSACPNELLSGLLQEFVNSQNEIEQAAGRIALTMLDETFCTGATVTKCQRRSGRYGKSENVRVVRCGHPNSQMALSVLEAVRNYTQPQTNLEL